MQTNCFTNFSKTTAPQQVFQGKLSTISIFKPSKFNVKSVDLGFCVAQKNTQTLKNFLQIKPQFYQNWFLELTGLPSTPKSP